MRMPFSLTRTSEKISESQQGKRRHAEAGYAFIDLGAQEQARGQGHSRNPHREISQSKEAPLARKRLKKYQKRAPGQTKKEN